MKKNRRKGPTLVMSDNVAEAGLSDATPAQLSTEGDAVASSATGGGGVSFTSVPVIASLLVGAATLAWAYWPTWVSLATVWEREPDYSHGWFVIPIALYLLWSTKQSMPAAKIGIHVGGLILVLSLVALRVFGRWAYFDFVDGITLPLTVIGFVWVLFGSAWARWSLPALMFLFFMIPLPFRIENELSRPLQWIATNLSTYTLQLLGRPAIPEGTTILLGDQTLEVERACSGLRIFFGVFALAYATAFLAKRVWWERVILIGAAIPIALIANATRIVLTGLFYEWLDGEKARQLVHDWAGYFMIGVAASLFGLTLLYLRHLVPDGESVDRAALRRA
jgi:exosortase